MKTTPAYVFFYGMKDIYSNFHPVDFIHQGHGELSTALVVDAQATVHRAEDRPEEALLEVMDLTQAHGVDVPLLDFVDFEGDNSVLAVVAPELVFAGLLVPGLAIVFPVDVVLAVH